MIPKHHSAGAIFQDIGEELLNMSIPDPNIDKLKECLRHVDIARDLLIERIEGHK